MSKLRENNAKSNTIDDADSHSKEKKIIRKRAIDPSFKSHIKYTPEITRRSARIAKAETVINYNEVDSSESDSEKQKVSDDRISKAQSLLIDNTFRVRDLSQNNRYDLGHEKEDYATICHHCQEFSTDTKALCQNVECIAVNQQLCGPCLSDYYGEDLESALKDSEWHCPFCRGICSCSLCEIRSSTRILHRFDYKKEVNPHIEDKEYLQTDENLNSEYELDVMNEFCDLPEENSALAENNKAFFMHEKSKFERTCTVF